MRYQNIREEELKLKVAADYFWLHDCTRIIGNVYFCVQAHQAEPSLFERESLLWAEAKTGSSNLYHSLTQLVLTIGKACTVSGTGQNKAGTVIENKTYQR